MNKDIEMKNQGQSILIVDDEPMIRRLLNLKLSRQGYYCEEAGNFVSLINHPTSGWVSSVAFAVTFTGVGFRFLLITLSS